MYNNTLGNRNSEQFNASYLVLHLFWPRIRQIKDQKAKTDRRKHTKCLAQCRPGIRYTPTTKYLTL